MSDALGWRVTGAALGAWLERLLAEEVRVVAPVHEDGLRIFRSIVRIDEIDLGPGTTRWSPKELLLPRTERLYTYTRDNDTVLIEDPRDELGQQLLLGARCCDAAGLQRLDQLLLGPQPDPLYARRRAITTIATVACEEAAPECFCTAVGVSPGGVEGSDIVLVRDGDSWLIRAVTSKGSSLLGEDQTDWTPAASHDWQGAEARLAAVEEAISRQALDPACGELLERSFDSELWQDLGRRCLGCGLCAAVCPSCSCFDMSHEGNPWSGAQVRTWDSCALAVFTRHASGHNPRSSQRERYRQRVLHKFAFQTVGSTGTFRCVGCGRCVALCPGGLAIHAAVEEIVRAAGEVTEDD
jgi:sulfhydrogenase subunit beta (sulfur reductase)